MFERKGKARTERCKLSLDTTTGEKGNEGRDLEEGRNWFWKAKGVGRIMSAGKGRVSGYPITTEILYSRCPYFVDSRTKVQVESRSEGRDVWSLR